ncbi:MAG TPA: hypothetical protein VK586_14475 [Streptosporangiaceae bacterium]|nr:hypothetical protein [Streptosporangiaceae bacterium]
MSRVPQAIAYLVTAFTAAPALGQATPPVSVIDGPAVTADPGPLALWVGVDSISLPAGALPAAASSTQVWQAGLARSARTEALSVFCTAQAQAGNDDVASLRAQAAAIMAAAESVVNGDPSLGGLLAGTADAVVTAAEWRQGPNPVQQGIAVRVTFTIDATAFISS